MKIRHGCHIVADFLLCDTLSYACGKVDPLLNSPFHAPAGIAPREKTGPLLILPIKPKLSTPSTYSSYTYSHQSNPSPPPVRHTCSRRSRPTTRPTHLFPTRGLPKLYMVILPSGYLRA